MIQHCVVDENCVLICRFNTIFVFAACVGYLYFPYIWTDNGANYLYAAN